MAKNSSNQTYDTIVKQLKTASLIMSANHLLEWDQETYMPQGGLSNKTEQGILLKEIHHKLVTSKRFSKLLNELIDLNSGKILREDLSSEKKAALREMRRDYIHEKKIPASFVKKFTETTSVSVEAWKVARANDSFKTFAPHLKKIFSLLRKKADYLGFQKSPYDALLDEYEPGMTSEKIDEVFSKLKEKTVSLLRKIEQKQKKPAKSPLEGDFPIDQQRMLCRQLIKDMGLSEDNYNLSETHHPFCRALHPDDIRMTTHYYKDNLFKGFLSTMHECGHALYEHGLPKEHFGSPLGQPASFAVHESQSRIWETFFGHSHPFLKLYYGKIKEMFPNALQGASCDDLYQAVNQVGPSLIRIYADEVTYNLHIIIRYEIEKGLIEGKYEVKDLPDIWQQKMSETLGITPKTNADGCLQDIHWSLGLVGYFPSYTLGNIYAGQLYLSIIKTFTNWDQRIKSGDLLFIRDFLKEKVHKFGRQYSPHELIEKASGQPFSIDPYFAYLDGKYTPSSIN